MNSKDSILFEKKAATARNLARPAHAEDRLFPLLEDFSELSVACYRSDFSASRISHAVEDADAHLLNLNVTSETLPSGQIVVDLRISHRDAGAVSRSLERYGFSTVRISSGNDSMRGVVEDRIASLLAQINV